MKAWQPRKRRGRPAPQLDDRGTPQAQARRLALVSGADPALSEYPLGIMLARGLVAGPQHEAGCYYALLYGRVVGRTQITCAPLYRQVMGELAPSGGQQDEGMETRLQELFRFGKNRLLAAGRRVCDATENVVVFQRLPRFLDPWSARPQSARRADATELDAVLAGLDVLVACYGRAAGRAGRMEEHRAPSLVQAR